MQRIHFLKFLRRTYQQQMYHELQETSKAYDAQLLIYVFCQSICSVSVEGFGKKIENQGAQLQALERATLGHEQPN